MKIQIPHEAVQAFSADHHGHDRTVTFDDEADQILDTCLTCLTVLDHKGHITEGIAVSLGVASYTPQFEWLAKQALQHNPKVQALRPVQPLYRQSPVSAYIEWPTD